MTTPSVPAINLHEMQIETVVDKILESPEESIRVKVINMVVQIQNQTVDWQRKDGAISSMRRGITRVLSDVFSAVDAKSKAGEIVEALLEVR